jgi:hypothetical protein
VAGLRTGDNLSAQVDYQHNAYSGMACSGNPLYARGAVSHADCSVVQAFGPNGEVFTMAIAWVGESCELVACGDLTPLPTVGCLIASAPSSTARRPNRIRTGQPRGLRGAGHAVFSLEPSARTARRDKERSQDVWLYQFSGPGSGSLQSPAAIQPPRPAGSWHSASTTSLTNFGLIRRHKNDESKKIRLKSGWGEMRW